MTTDFAAFFDQHERRIHYLIRRLTIPHSLYDDFYAEGIVALWQAFEDYEASKGQIGTFLNYRIRFRLLDLQRKMMREQASTERAKEAQMLEAGAGNRIRATNDLLVDARGIELPDETFWRDVRSVLTDNQWKWVNYFVVQELSIKEIMALENVSEGAVKGWARQTRKKLKNHSFKEKMIN